MTGFLDNADITSMQPPVSGRLSWENGRIIPKIGDLARVTKDVTLESGCLLPANQNVLIEHVSAEAPSVVGVKWGDGDGTHVMALEVSKLEVVA